MIGYRFSKYIPKQKGETPFDKLFNIFKELLNYTSGDVSETLSWMSELDKEYKLTDDNYGMGDFIQDLKDKGYLKENEENGNMQITAKTEQAIRQSALEEIFGKLKKSKRGEHKTNFSGMQGETGSDTRAFQFGDSIDQLDMTETLKASHINHGFDNFQLTENDLHIREQELTTNTATVLMIDISHSMILYGEDRITPAKKVAMALAELITTKYPKDSLDIIVFGNDAWQIAIKDLPYLQVGPFHTNTVAGLELAMDLLRRKKTPNKQIFMITDGKPTCLKENGQYYKNSFGLDRKVINKTLTLAKAARKLKIPITTFMIASDHYLQQFVEEFTQVNNGKAFYSSLKGLGELVFEDYAKNKRKRIR